MLYRLRYIFILSLFSVFIQGQNKEMAVNICLTDSCLHSVCDDSLSLIYNNIVAIGLDKLSDSERRNVELIKREEKRRTERKKAIEEFLLSSNNAQIKKVLNEIDMRSINYCAYEGFINKVEYYDSVRDFINKDEYLVKNAYFITITKAEMRIGTGGYSRHPQQTLKLKEGTNNEYEKVESFMYSPGGVTLIYTIDEDNTINYSHSEGIG